MVESICLKVFGAATSDVGLATLAILLAPLVLIGVRAAWSVHVQIAKSRPLDRRLLLQEVQSQPVSLTHAAERAGVRDRVRLFESSNFSAFCFGLLRPTVWISTAALAALDEDELEAVLRHEAWHLRQRDPIRVLIARACTSAAAFLPMVSIRLRSYVLERELQADAAVVRDMSDAYPLAAALQRASAVTQQPLAGAVGAFNSIDARIDQLLAEDRPDAGRPGLAAAVIPLVYSALPTAMVCAVVTIV